VLTSDKRFDFGAGGVETWPAWRTAQDRLAKVLNAKHVSDTNSGHAIQMEQPQLVIDAIREVIEAVRSGSHQVARNETDAELSPIAELARTKFPPGKGFLYSSLNTIVLGRILEKIAESFDELLRERLLKPLALDRTKLDTDGKLDPPFCHGYTDFCRNMPRQTDTSEWPRSLLPPARSHRPCPTCIDGESRWGKDSA